MKYLAALIVCGFVWFGVSGLLAGAFSQYIVSNLVCSVVTAVWIGYAFRRSIVGWRGWKFFFLLPLLVLAVAILIWGFLLPIGWYVSDSSRGVQSSALVHLGTTAFYYFVYAMTLFLPILFPVALGTNVVLRSVLAGGGEAAQPVRPDNVG